MKTSITSQNLTATINHSGAELSSLINKNGKELIWNANPLFWNKHSPVLFPIVGSLKNNAYNYENADYKMSRHGFARDCEFELIDHQIDNCTFSLKESPATFKIYPFKFELQIKYQLNKDQLTIEYRVFNRNAFKMPFSIGAHPAFALNQPFENYTIEMDADDHLQCNLLNDGLMTETKQTIHLVNKKLPLLYSLFINDVLVIKKFKSKSITIHENNKPYIKVHLNEFPNLGIWTKPTAPFICIEPWQGYSDSIDTTSDLFNKEGIVSLNQKSEWCASFGIEPL